MGIGQKKMTSAQVAECLRLDAKTVAQLDKEGIIPAEKIRGRWEFTHYQVEAWRQKHMTSRG